MTTAPMLFDAYTMAADNLIAVMMHDDQLCSRVQDDLRLHPGWFPTVQHIQAFSAILALRNTGHTDSLHATAVMNLAPMVKSEWLGRLYSNGLDAGGNVDPILTTHFNSDAEIVKEHGKRKGLVNEIRKADAAIASGKTNEEVVTQLMTAMSTAGRDVRIENIYAGEHVREFQEFMDSEPPSGLTTGIQWLDELTGGFAAPRFWQILGAYKQRKTTTALNAAIGLLLSGGSVTIMSRELLRLQINAQMVAMLMVAWMVKEGFYNQTVATKDKDGNPYNFPLALISADILIRTRKYYQRWHKVRQDAFKAAMQVYGGFGRRLRVYDTSERGGGLHDMATAEKWLRRDLRVDGLDLSIFDYGGLFAAPGNGMYEQYEYRARKFQEWVSWGKPILVLLQRNEEAIKRGDGESYSPGAFGGSSFPAAADYLITTKYTEVDRNGESDFKLAMSHSRHSGTGSHEFKMHSPSGLIIGNSWIKDVK